MTVELRLDHPGAQTGDAGPGPDLDLLGPDEDDGPGRSGRRRGTRPQGRKKPERGGGHVASTEQWSRLASPRNPASGRSSGAAVEGLGRVGLADPARGGGPPPGRPWTGPRPGRGSPGWRWCRPSRSTAQHVGTHRGPQRGVERGEGLVEQHQRRARWPGRGPGPPAAAGPRTAGAGSAGRARARPTSSSSSSTRPSRPGPRQAERHVAADAEVREQGALLGHVADAPVLGGTKRWPASSTTSSPSRPPRSGRSKPATSAAGSSCRSPTARGSR